MFSIIVAPGSLADAEYVDISPMEEVHPLRLLTVERQLDEQIKQVSRIIKELRREIDIQDPELGVLLSTCKSTQPAFSMKSFETLSLEIEAKIAEIQRSISGRADDKKASAIKHTGDAPPKHMFIDCLRCLVSWKHRKAFAKLFDPRILIFHKRVDEKAVYTAYCLKSETKAIKEYIRGAFHREVGFISEEVFDHVLNPPDLESIEIDESDGLRALLVQSVELLVFACVLRGFAEVLNKYGMEPDFKYKITSRVESEVKRMVKLGRRKDDVHDSIAIIALWHP